MTSTEMWDLVLMVLMVNAFVGTAYLLSTADLVDPADETTDEWP